MRSHLIQQLIKFSLTGVVNTAVDFAILNLLIYLFGLQTGDPRFIVFKTISASVAIINSYVLNKFWVFKRRMAMEAAGGAQTIHVDSPENTSREATKFIGVSLIGLVINAVVASLAFAAGHSLWPTVSPQLIANACSLVAIIVVMISNFIGYKFLVFKR